MVQITDMRASPDSEGWRRRVLVVSTNAYILSLTGLTISNHDKVHG